MTIDAISGPASYTTPLRDSTVAKQAADQPVKADSFGPAVKTDLSNASVSIELAQWDIYKPWAEKNHEYTSKVWELAKAQFSLDPTTTLGLR